MYVYQPTTDANGLRLFLIQGCGHPGQSRYQGDFGHIEVKVVREVDAKYDGADREGYRWASWTGTNEKAYFVEDLTITCQFEKRGEQRDGQPYLYAFKAVYRDTFQVETRDAVAMARTLTRIQKVVTGKAGFMDSGSPVEFASFVRDVGKTLGIHTVLFYENDKARGDLDHPGNLRVSPHFWGTCQSIRRIVYDICGLSEKQPA